MRTDEELKQIAVDIYEGRIFTDRSISEGCDAGMVFLPVILGAFKDESEEGLKDIKLIFEYMDKAGPRSINGMPMFFSCQVLRTDDFKKMSEYFDKYKTLKESF